MKKIIQTTISLFVILIIYSCVSSQITSVWKTPEPPNNVKKILVLGIIREADRTLRINMENHLTSDLKKLGYYAFSAYQLYGPKEFENMSEQDVTRKLNLSDIDAVLTIVLLDKQKERMYVPGHIVYSPYGAYHERLYGYYQSLANRISAQGYYEMVTKYFWESNLYDVRNNKLLYSVQTQSFDPLSTNILAHEYGRKIVQSMVSDDVLQKNMDTTAKPL
jgi:hypothetical protein